jgi:hypothetical protein
MFRRYSARNTQPSWPSNSLSYCFDGPFLVDEIRLGLARFLRQRPLGPTRAAAGCIPESGKFSHVQISLCAGAGCARWGVRFSGRRPDPANDQCWSAYLQDGAFDWTDLWVAAENGLPLRSQWSVPARGLCRYHGYNWSRCRHHCRRRHGMGRIGAHGRSNAWKTCWYLCGRERRRWRWCRRWRQPPLRRNGAFDRFAAALGRRVGWSQPVSWSFKSHACLRTMRT